MSRSVLVTGANGFIGRHAVRRLARDGHTVTALQRSSDRPCGAREVLAIPDLDPDCLRDTLRGRHFDWVIHLAGAGTHPSDRDPSRLFRVNGDATRALAELAAGWQGAAMFVAGSGSEYAARASDVPLLEDSPLEVHRTYGASKAVGTLSAVATAHARGLPLAAGRLFNVYGPGEAPHRLLPSLYANLTRGRRVPLSAGRQRRSFVYVEDAVDAMVALLWWLERHRSALAINIAGQEIATVRGFAETVAQALDADPALLGFGDIPVREDDVPFFGGDAGALRRLTGWQPAHDLRAGISRSISVLKAEGRPSL